MSGKRNGFHVEKGTATISPKARAAIVTTFGVKTTSLTPHETRVLRLAMKRKYKTDLPSRLKKLGEEYGELAEAIANNDPKAIAQEAADIQIVLSHIGIVCGFSLAQASTDKLTEVERRHVWEVLSHTSGEHYCTRCEAICRNPHTRKNERCPKAI